MLEKIKNAYELLKKALPDLSYTIPTEAYEIPQDTSKAAIAKFIDHTILKQEATPDQVKQLCEEAKEHQFASVCVNPCYVDCSYEFLTQSNVPVCSVIGFPLGTNTTSLKIVETEKAVQDGAKEIDMVIHVGQLKAQNYDYVRNDIRAVVKAAGEAHVKVIHENCLLTEEEKIIACMLSVDAGAHFVKTSTGFNSGGATIEDVQLMRTVVGPHIGVKAAGGIRDYETAVNMVKAGANRIGASASVTIVS